MHGQSNEIDGTGENALCTSWDKDALHCNVEALSFRSDLFENSTAPFQAPEPKDMFFPID